MLPVCSACGQENPEGARFCNSCGEPLGAGHEAAREERKVVTVFFGVSDLEAALDSKPVETRWMEAARAYGRRAFVESAEIL
jgi:hypothetical protein